MADKLYEESDVREIANSIRAKNGGSTKYKLSEMAGAIDSLTLSELIQIKDLPEGVKNAALETAKKAAAVQTSDSITFIAASDAHKLATDSRTETAITYACMGIKALSYVVPNVAFRCFLGDYLSEGTTKDDGIVQIKSINALLSEGFEEMVQFRTAGEDDMVALSKSNYYSLISKYAAYSEDSIAGSYDNGWNYNDFSDLKLRVFCLNTSDGYYDYANVSKSQQLWFARELKKVGAKDGWGVIILSHYPLDFTGDTSSDTNASAVGTILRQYTLGGSVTLQGVKVDFGEYNKTKIYGTFHGHTHNYAYAKLRDAQDSLAEFNILRIAVPNMGWLQNNEAVTDANGISYTEGTTCDKGVTDADFTSVTVNVVNPTEGKIYSFCFGTGYDREISIP